MKIKNAIKDEVVKHPDNDGDAIESEEQFLDLKRKRYENELESLINDNNARKRFGNNIFDFTIVWLVFVLLVFIWVGMGKLHYSDPVLITFITTTTGTAVGFLIIVFNYLFKGKSKQE